MKRFRIVFLVCILSLTACSGEISQKKSEIQQKELTQQEAGTQNKEGSQKENTQKECAQEEGTQKSDNSGETAVITQEGQSPEEKACPSYQLNLRFDPVLHTISGTEIVTLTNSSDDAWNQLCFRDYPSDRWFAENAKGRTTDITNISLSYPAGNTSEGTLIRDMEENTILYFPLEKALQPQESITVSFELCVYIPVVNDRFGHSELSDNLGYFFPILSIYREGSWVNHPPARYGECAYSECAEFDVKVTAPEDYTIITTGELLSKENHVSTFHAEKVRDFTMVIGNQYDVVSEENNGVTINSYYKKGNDKAGKRALDAAVASVKAYTKAIGAYPYPSLDCVETSIGGGMEYPQLIMLADELYSLDNEALSMVTAHETAHQWFYGIIGNDQYDEAWIDEGFASYLEGVYYEATGQDSLAIRYEERAISEEVYSRGNGSKNEVERKNASINQSYDVYGETSRYVKMVYHKAAEFLITLRQSIGEDAFTSAVQQIYTTYKFKEATTEEILDIFKSNTDKDLTALFDYYFYPEEK